MLSIVIILETKDNEEKSYNEEKFCFKYFWRLLTGHFLAFRPRKTYDVFQPPFGFNNFQSLVDAENKLIQFRSKFWVKTSLVFGV